MNAQFAVALLDGDKLAGVFFADTGHRNTFQKFNIYGAVEALI
jgi:hypothetical protein